MLSSIETEEEFQHQEKWNYNELKYNKYSETVYPNTICEIQNT